ncbi:hypothetical protein [Streptomyces afghaniensis]|uniref:hypothetical protein n=1 Tax=Streptomyces afghaniensis TaxID=66865 RepID=UPI00278B2103|nr:hypothetical protein [Streptomyces afghaniensis]MDQ1016754.1 hypothetical protein [Streptomyces afghaniensis]
MTTTNRPPKPQLDTGAVGETDPFSPRAARGRHRKPRPRKALLAAGGLVLAAGALSLVRLASGPGTDSVGSVEAEPRPDPVTTATDEAMDTAATVPEASPSSPTALGGLTPSPGTHRPAAASPTPSPPASVSIDTRRADTAETGRSTTIPDTTNPPAPTARGEAPRPAPTPPAPPSRATPAPAAGPEKPKKPRDPDLCVPVIGVCVDPLD